MDERNGKYYRSKNCMLATIGTLLATLWHSWHQFQVSFGSSRQNLIYWPKNQTTSLACCFFQGKKYLFVEVYKYYLHNWKLLDKMCVCVQYPPLVDVSFPLLKGETTTFTTLSTPSSSIPSRGENVAALLRIYLKYNLLEDAAELLVYIFERTQVFFLKNNGTSFPTLEDVIF